ncbi:RhoGAP domain-containing protein [Dictyostelium discoideum AX4]|uniref:Rho GTPase-activating protein gacH n=1 Tax=Dictyostelium discoideum TaxID=44689 RepID=GACH_DICDI|nr:RhoGAP domain-containing protein [Dictyostelium discoideum AX4]Q86IG9.1 RecName: Full=Rho GTPase-activating protein gacH; AltName: Full=GTPase activating factor for raC protein H [Dictyostelium discoideum]EAL70984.1 RhoGAP domain-containing protein [Dictyostelium discoideum AX4]|eukprot:XP_644893.1 RhoGAP domain-containing protein [Dictyostelium discoideum AX4]
MSGVGGESVHLRRSSTTATTTGSSKSSLNISKSVSPTGNKAVSPMSSPNSLQSGATPTIAQLQSLLKQQQQPNHSITTNNNNNKSVSVEIDDLKSQLQHSNINDTFNEDEEIEEVTDEVIINHDYHSSEDEYEDDEDEDENNNSVNNNSNNNSNNNNNNNTSISSAHSCESIAEEEELTASPILSRQYSYTIGHGTKPDVVLSIGGGFHSSPRSNRSESTIVHEDDLTNQNDKVINAKDKISSDYKRMMEDPEAFRNEKLKQRKSKFFTKKDLEEIPFNPSSGTQLRSTLFQQFMNEKIQMISENPEKYKSELMKFYKQNLKPQVPKSPQSSGSLSTHSDKLKTSSSLQRSRSVSQPPVVTGNSKNAIGSLDTILEKERKRDGNQDRQLPILFTKCVDFLSNDEALKTEGLFRVAGNSSEVEDLMKSILLYGSDIPSNCCYHVVSNMLKKFLRQLSTPVFTFKYHNDFIQTMKLNNDEERIKAIKEILKLIPPVNQLLIKELMKFLVKVTSFSNVNMMHAHNLGLMFGPNMLKAPSDSEMNAISMLDAGNQVITLLIENYNLFYDN